MGDDVLGSRSSDVQIRAELRFADGELGVMNETGWRSLLESSLVSNFGDTHGTAFDVRAAEQAWVKITCHAEDRKILQTSMTLISSADGRRCRIDSEVLSTPRRGLSPGSAEVKTGTDEGDHG
mmetsp:Transcript_36724/g.146855  ORF Transcript_36724/g.146855 Transcript_36724/m.146855 type:complete len:123 (+) Transcript_36724:3974-4342(+)|eukprot:CAMPEP_0113970026 /NCGR_PEP_ID=MMETSP0011_2-20120614/10804_1 /TAXON_ID=101924 /ORGANISM="Rhodosorus marinus" /LENGTH=122 /DNA_ID=CAMNT_0000984069 /DNA_START=102 /DNA_END=470 /DNA_ORIENTATION=+ /assembly_acc=CAM_ASM_000156